MKLIVKTVYIDAPGPFTNDEASALVDFLELALDNAIEAAVSGVLDAAKRHHPLASSARVIVAD